MWQTSWCVCVCSFLWLWRTLTSISWVSFYLMIDHVVERIVCMCPCIISGKENVELLRYIKIHNVDTKNCKRLLHDFSTSTSKWWFSTTMATIIMVEASVRSECISPPCQSTTIMWLRWLKTTIWERCWGLWVKHVTLYWTWCTCPVRYILITLYYPQKFDIQKSYHSTIEVIIFLKLFLQKTLCLISASARVCNCNVVEISQN